MRLKNNYYIYYINIIFFNTKNSYSYFNVKHILFYNYSFYNYCKFDVYFTLKILKKYIFIFFILLKSI